ncbi:unnamed protein product [Prorocentrum cordatum]|uniref:Uncharacterized protein n=1 Tax=Prorocentrum cordatum TaxID=2364126 RepID=A0ABN9QYY0_9DINO|nr:unnamed protein product [Polarella glacialis]
MAAALKACPAEAAYPSGGAAGGAAPGGARLVNGVIVRQPRAAEAETAPRAQAPSASAEPAPKAGARPRSAFDFEQRSRRDARTQAQSQSAALQDLRALQKQRYQQGGWPQRRVDLRFAPAISEVHCCRGAPVESKGRGSRRVARSEPLDARALPPCPLALLREWLGAAEAADGWLEAWRPPAMTLATSSAAGGATARSVLLQDISASGGLISRIRLLGGLAEGAPARRRPAG